MFMVLYVSAANRFGCVAILVCSTFVFSNFSISYMSLLLFLGSGTTRDSGNGRLVSYLIMLFIDLTWCPIFASSSLILSVFVFGRNSLITAL